MVMIGGENGDDSVSVCTTSQKRMPIQIQAKPTTQLRLKTLTQESKLTNRLSWVSLDRPLSTWPDGQVIR